MFNSPYFYWLSNQILFQVNCETYNKARQHQRTKIRALGRPTLRFFCVVAALQINTKEATYWPPLLAALYFQGEYVQTKVVGLCSVGALLGFGAWFIKEPSFEPAIGFITGIGVLAANYWPKKSKNYASNRRKGRKSFDYGNNNGRFVIGDGELKFETSWSKAGGDSIHVYNDPASIKGVALVQGVSAINLISNAISYDFSSRSRTPKEGEIVVFENSYGNFAAILVIDIKDNTREDAVDELTFEYVINPNGHVDFT